MKSIFSIMFIKGSFLHSKYTTPPYSPLLIPAISLVVICISNIKWIHFNFLNFFPWDAACAIKSSDCLDHM